MPFCATCGTAVEGRFCEKCGTPIAAAPMGAAPPPAAGPVYQPAVAATGLADNVASALCYALGFITGIIFLGLAPYNQNKTVRFHAFQGLYLFVAWLIADQVVRPMFWRIPRLHIYGLIEAVLVGASVFMMVKAAHQETYALPLFGELAQRSIAED